ncbi:hypothetical protein VC39_05940 [Vibrio cholerae]|nr:hypothetical protein VC39_05940 [Vibrio cholerae]OXB32286.1 hypothetical protein CEF09_06520 [Vibrio cholerae]
MIDRALRVLLAVKFGSRPAVTNYAAFSFLLTPILVYAQSQIVLGVFYLVYFVQVGSLAIFQSKIQDLEHGDKWLGRQS